MRVFRFLRALFCLLPFVLLTGCAALTPQSITTTAQTATYDGLVWADATQADCTAVAQAASDAKNALTPGVGWAAVAQAIEADLNIDLPPAGQLAVGTVLTVGGDILTLYLGTNPTAALVDTDISALLDGINLGATQAEALAPVSTSVVVTRSKPWPQRRKTAVAFNDAEKAFLAKMAALHQQRQPQQQRH